MAHLNNVVIQCSALVFLFVSSVRWTNAEGTVRLVNDFDSSPHKGRVEIYYGQTWGTICDDGWDLLDADVVCRQLGYTGALRALERGYFGPGDNLIWLDNVGCTGNEARIEDCSNSGWGSHNCVHLEDASVECSTATVRLESGTDRYEGNVQVLVNDTEWGYVCDDDWDDHDGNVACRQLDQRQSDYIRINSSYGAADGPLALNNVECVGTELTLQQCPHGDIGSCTRFNKAGVSCVRDEYEEGAVRLAGTGYPNRGRVEIYHNGEWGTVCDDYWDYYDAKVVCRQLGYLDSQPKAYYKSYFGAGQGRIWLDNMACGGGETRLELCLSSNGWGSHDCSHNEDAGVYCDERGEFDAAEITGIVIASLFGASILFCCVKYICCEAASNKRYQRRHPQARVRRQTRRSPAAATRQTDPEEHFNAHFNNAYTISDNHDDVFTPPGFPYPPPFPGTAPPPFSPTDLPPAYESIMSTPVPTNNGTSPGATDDGIITGNSVDASDVAMNPTAVEDPHTPLPTTTSVNAVPVAMPARNIAYPPEPVMSQQALTHPSATMPPIETTLAPPIIPAGNQEEQKESLQSSSQFTYPVHQVQQSSVPLPYAGVSENPDNQVHASSLNTNAEETNITFVANAQQSIDMGLTNDRLSDA